MSGLAVDRHTDGRVCKQKSPRGYDVSPMEWSGQSCHGVQSRTILSERFKDVVMAKGLQRQSREARKPKKEKPKTIAAAPSAKGTPVLGQQKSSKS